MAGNHYRGGERGSYGRTDSIFDDDPRDSRDRDWQNRSRLDRDDGRGFFQRAGEEVRSWFGGDEESGRSGGQSSSRSHYGDYQSYGGSSGTGRVQSWGEANSQGPNEPWGGGSDWGGTRNQGSYDRTGGQSPFDDHYRSWRERQISQLDQEYHEYCRDRQQQFESDFTNWRHNRTQASDSGQQGLSQTGATGMAGGRTGSQGLTEGSGTTSGGQGGSSRGSSPAMPSGGATSEGGSNLSPDASTGSSGRQPGSRGRRS